MVYGDQNAGSVTSLCGHANSLDRWCVFIMKSEGGPCFHRSRKASLAGTQFVVGGVFIGVNDVVPNPFDWCCYKPPIPKFGWPFC